VDDTPLSLDPSAPPPAGAGLYTRYDRSEEMARTTYHYEKPSEFFTTLTGGEWNVYSGLLWEDGFTVTQAQEKKLDCVAELLGLRPGMRVLDVGCGWGGPLVYLCRRYGVSGHGITITPGQLPIAQARAARHGVNARFEVRHWEDLPEVAAYDAIYSDEVLVHFPNLKVFFAKASAVLCPGGRMAHKELHLVNSRHATMSRFGKQIHQVYGYSGHYVPLHAELSALDAAGFDLEHVVEIPLEHYHRTMLTWLKHLAEGRARLTTLVGADVYRQYCIYLRGYRRMFDAGVFRLDVISSIKKDTRTEGE
jgi:cyclopropane-fatty-acyl-phospholipid synthase